MDDDQVPSQRAGEGSGPPREPDSAAVKGVSELKVWSAEDRDEQFTERQCQEIIRHKQVPGWQMEKILGNVSIRKELIDTYLRFRQLLGNDVRMSHKAWEELQATNAHPLLKVVGLAFGVISTPETTSYMEQLWDQLREHMDQDSPDAIIARAMMDYARAWAYHREDLGKALNIVTAFYEEMENGDSSNFFLAPCYTVTIGRWIYDANCHRLSDKVIEDVKYYACKTLRQIRSLKDEWAIIDTFGMKLNAMVLLLRVKRYYTANSLGVENLEGDIEDLLGELQRTLSHPKITTYDKAGFYSVSKLFLENVNKEEFCRRAKLSAKLFRQNGRIWRALEEAELSGDAELLRELLNEAQDIPEPEPEIPPTWRSDYEEAVKKQGYVEVAINRCIFAGPPGKGKSCLKYLLVHDKPEEVKTSTGVMEKPDVVTISAEKFAVKGTSVWLPLTNGKMASSIKSSCQKREYHTPKDGLKDRRGKLAQPVFEINPPTSHSSYADSSDTESDSLHLQLSANTADVSAFQKAHFRLMRDRSLEEGILLNGAQFIHLLDTGGQPSFQAVLPLLLAVPCTYVLVFNAAEGLNAPIPITYRPDDTTVVESRSRPETAWAMMLRSLSSAYTLVHKVSGDVQALLVDNRLPPLRTVIVGTFADQLEQMGNIATATEEIGRQIKQLKNKPYYSSLISNSDGQQFHLVNNLPHQEASERTPGEQASINNLREVLSHSDGALNAKIPIGWYHFEMLSRMVEQKFFNFSELLHQACELKCITSADPNREFRSLLQLFHSLGVFTFIDREDVSHMVCTDSSVFLQVVSKLLAVKFKDPKCSAVRTFKETGILSLDTSLFNELGISKEVDQVWLLRCLCYLGVAANLPLPTSDTPEYFIPAALPSEDKENVSEYGSVAPLMVAFQFQANTFLSTEDFPHGIFARLAVELANKRWNVIGKKNTRLVIRFQWKELYISIVESAGCIRIIPIVSIHARCSVAELHKRCAAVRSTVEAAIQTSAQAVFGSKFAEKAKPIFAFECTCKVLPSHFAVPSENTLVCNLSSDDQEYMTSQRVWFCPIEGAQLQPHPSNPTVLQLVDPTSGGGGSLSIENEDILSQKVSDHQEHLLLFRLFVSRTAAKKGRAVLEGLGLRAHAIDACFSNHPLDEEGAVQEGLTKWSGGQSHKPPTWQVLLEAMEYARIDKEHVHGLRRLGLQDPERPPTWRSDYEEAVKKHGSVKVTINRCILAGPPGKGKSCLKHLLVHDKPKEVKTSTGVMEKPDVVTISAEKYAVEGTSVWLPLTDGKMASAIKLCCQNRKYHIPEDIPEDRHGKLAQPVTEINPPSAAGKATSHSSRADPSDTERDSLYVQPSTSPTSHSSCAEGSENESDSLHLQPSVNPMDVSAFHKAHFELMRNPSLGEGILLNGAQFVHLLDTGGQPSFQAVLPLLLDVPCTYVLVFNAAEGLNTPIPITYRPDDTPVVESGSRPETAWAMMLRSLSSAYTLVHKVSSDVQALLVDNQLPPLRTVLVGTFADQLEQMGNIATATEEIDRQIKQLENRPYYSSLIPNSDGQLFHLVNNLPHQEVSERTRREKASVNRLREVLSHRDDALNAMIPIAWYQFEMVTRMVDQKFFELSELLDHAIDLKYITSADPTREFHSLLQLFHSLGVFTFIDRGDVSHMVCTDSSVFLQVVSKLLAVKFKVPKCIAVRIFKETGILSLDKSLLNELGISQEVDPEWLLCCLCYLGVAACLSLPSAGTLKYFIPAALPSEDEENVSEHGSVAPLQVAFQFDEANTFLSTEDLPHGIFARLAVELANKRWKVIRKKNTRLVIRFQWKELYISIVESAGCIRIIPIVSVPAKCSVAELHERCTEVRATVKAAIQTSAQAVFGSKFAENAKPIFAFECPCKVLPSHFAVPSEDTLACNLSTQRQEYLTSQRVWFCPIEGAQLQPHPSNPTILQLVDPTSGGGRGRGATTFPVSELLTKHEREFFSVVNARFSLLRLKRLGVITQDVMARINAATNEEDAQEILYEHLANHADVVTLMRYFEVIIAANGYPKMQSLGRKMMEELQPKEKCEDTVCHSVP